MTTTIAKSIAVSDAATQLGITEVDFRNLLKGIYKNPSTIKKISLDNFKMLAEAMQERVTTELEPENEAEPIVEEPSIEKEVDPTVEEPSIQNEVEPTTEDTEPEAEHTSLATTDPQALDMPPERAKTLLNINLNLSNQVLDLNKITSALAVVTGEEAVRNFEEIYTHTFNTGIDRVIQNVASQAYNTIQNLREVDNADFLEGKGRAIATTDSQTAIDLVCQFL